MSENKPTAPCCSYSPCGCVGYGYVPDQELLCTYDVLTALEKGSLFPELSLSIEEYGKICKCCEGGNCNE